VVKEYSPGARLHSPTEFLEVIKNDRGLEGCVLRFIDPPPPSHANVSPSLFRTLTHLWTMRDRFDDGDMFKIKTLWYHNLNRGLHMMTKTKTNNEKFMYYSTLPPIPFHTNTQRSLS
jgi:hypothetical protein